MSRPTANLRLFVAIYPPRALAEQLLQKVAAMDLPPNRLTPLEQVHLTVQFIGDTPANQMDSTIESVERSAAGLSPFLLLPARLISLPQRGRARLIAAEFQSHPTLLELHRRLVTRLARNIREKASDRFLPHMTLCRFRSPTRGISVDEPVPHGPFEIKAIALMRSTLSPTGAAHHEVAAFPLK